MSHYLSPEDITDKVVLTFLNNLDSRYESWFKQCDQEIEAIAMDEGILPSMIKQPLDTRIYQYAVAWLCMKVCFDNILFNNPDNMDTDKYKIKYEVYRTEAERLRSQITRNMFYIEDKSMLPVDRIGGSGAFSPTAPVSHLQ